MQAIKRVSLAASGCCLFTAILTLSLPGKRAVSSVSIETNKLTSVPTRMEFGSMSPGEVRKCSFALRNPGSTSLQVRSKETSCDCFSIMLEEDTVSAGGGVAGVATLSIASDARYRGRLELEVRLLDAERTVLAQLTAAVVVRDRDAHASR